MERPPASVNASARRCPRGRGGPAGRLAAAALAGLLLGGCALFESPRTLRGNQVAEEELRQVVPGVSSRDDVVALLGSPSATGTFDDGEWFYISAITRQRPGRQLAVEDQQVVVVRFDGRGTVSEVQRLGQEDGRPVQMVQRITPSPGNERTFLQQLFGNIGRVGPGLGATAGGAGPGGGPGR